MSSVDAVAVSGVYLDCRCCPSSRAEANILHDDSDLFGQCLIVCLTAFSELHINIVCADLAEIVREDLELLEARLRPASRIRVYQRLCSSVGDLGDEAVIMAVAADIDARMGDLGVSGK